MPIETLGMNRAHTFSAVTPILEHQDHAVFFYQKPEELTQVISKYFLSSAHKSNEWFILAARQKTWEQIKQFEHVEQKLLSRIEYIDADQIAHQLVDSQGQFLQEVFQQKIAKIVYNYHSDEKSLTIYGEIVDVLCSIGFYQAAQDLEKAWHQLIQKYSINLLCGYSHHHFINEKNHIDFVKTCDCHSRIEKPIQILTIDQNQLCREAVNFEHEKLIYQLKSESVEKRKALAYLGELQSEVFHEIKNIISVSALSTSQLNSMEKFIAPEMQARFARLISHITESQKGLNNIIGESMDLVRSQKEFWEKIDLNDCLLQAINLCSEQITKDGIELSMNVDKGAVEVFGVSEMIGRIFVNILENAIHALMEIPKTQSRLIQINSSILNGKAIVTITNNGPTISTQGLAKIFTPFYTTKKRGGTGIGLTYSKKIAQSHDGDIICESSNDIGVRFTLILPGCNS